MKKLTKIVCLTGGIALVIGIKKLVLDKPQDEEGIYKKPNHARKFLLKEGFDPIDNEPLGQGYNYRKDNTLAQIKLIYAESEGWEIQYSNPEETGFNAMIDALNWVESKGFKAIRGPIYSDGKGTSAMIDEGELGRWYIKYEEGNGDEG